MRYAFTIIYNGLHHLKHNNQAEQISSMVDHWVVVEGHSKPNGSTNWCKDIKMPKRSTDGTHEFMTEFAKTHPNTTYYSPLKYWKSKDYQANKCLLLLDEVAKSGYLWQIDIDEQWTPEQLDRCERHLFRNKGDVGSTKFNHYCGFVGDKKLIAVGEWGGAYVNRLFTWKKGDRFKSHEPSILVGQKRTIRLKEQFEHYAYCFEQDIEFKEKYYGYKGLKERWEALKKMPRFPVPISKLFGSRTEVGRSKSFIHLK